MLLKRLELYGLKSFADKTALDLSHNITAIVGPNGSGKSNITDAVRWLLGERDARNLRGAKGEDLIFAGTEKRPRMGLAEARLYFDNSSGFFPVDYKEVSISRRVSRDGVSQFFINKSEVRLKDLVDFLARVKLGARGLTIINQGESDAFIKAGPEERREMIEEMLGLKEYQLKKTDAIRKLKNTSVNLEKVNAMLEELRPHLRLLRRQSSRYENRERIEEELRELEDSFYGARLRRLREEARVLEKKEKEVSEKLKVVRPAFEKIEAEFQSVSKSEPEAAEGIKRIQKEKQEILSERSKLGRELGKLEAEIEFEEKRVPEVADTAKTLSAVKEIARSVLQETDAEKLRTGIRRIIETIEGPAPQARAGAGGIREKHEKLLGEFKEFDAKLAGFAKEEKAYQEHLEGFNKTFRDAYERVEHERKKLEESQREENNMKLARERVEVRLESLKEELSQIGRSITSLEEAVAKGNISSEVLVDEDAAMRKMYKNRQELASIGEVDKGIIKEAKETEERNEFLTKQIGDLERAAKDLKELIKELDTKIYTEFNSAIRAINEEFAKLIGTMFGGGRAKLIVEKPKQPPKAEEKEGGEESDEEVPPAVAERSDGAGVEIDIALPRKKVKGLEVLSGGERALVSIAALFALISVSPPPFLVLDEIDAALDEKNARRFGEILKDFAKKTQFVIVTHNRATMEAADVLYGVTMSADGTSKLVSLKLNNSRG